ncbi:hypothetical protein OCU04_006789 [Sclerotinia nivalis]|uniref:Aminoglycoside phosphotransferase domain-containing protein n=1 Tax=Sclerotinia nivalis TaxID=352851 RepID=A0A9X0AKG3_9HELO|nr:hypothetical protein OCU04_006789 [Sclerotinia nivalis]
MESDKAVLSESFEMRTYGDQAARYLLETYAVDGVDVDFARFLKDWKDLVRLFYVEIPHSKNLSWILRESVARRDGFRCCLTRVRCRVWSIWNVFPILPPTAFCIQEQRLYDMLGAFTTSSHQDLLKDKTLESQTRNHWTLSKDAAIPFSRGVIRLERLKGTKYNILSNDIGSVPDIYTGSRQYHWKCDLVDRSKSGIESPDPELLEIHSRFSKALNWTDVATNIDSRPRLRPSQNKDRNPFMQLITTTLLAIWTRLPEIVRIQTYKILRTAGSYLYEPATMIGVQRLPFGMYLKYGPRVHTDRHTAEFNALKVVQGRTSIPVPYPIDLLLSRTESFLVTSRIEGESVGIAIDECTDEEMHRMAQDLRSCIAELHTIKLDRDSKYSITNAAGGPCLDYRISSEVVGPFRNEKEFSESLRLGILPGLMHRTDHEIFFTHADLNMRNILVKDGRISGIVDWENAGWYPEYWEHTKCHFGVMIHKRWLKVIEAVFEDKYQEELGIERQYWEYHNGW